MSLRRAALVRRTPLRRTSLRRREVKVTRPRDTGPLPEVRALVYARAGFRCEVCGLALASSSLGASVHHRQPRGMGGSSRPELNLPSNLLLVCGSGVTGCHGLIEDGRAAAYAFGWLVRRPNVPAERPVVVEPHGWVLLTDDGCYLPSDGPP